MRKKKLYRVISLLALIALLMGQFVSVSSYSAAPKLSASLSGNTLTVKASGFPANARLKSLIVWNPGNAFEDFPLNITHGGKEYGYNDVMYGYEDFGSFVTTDGSGNLTFSFSLTSGTIEGDKVVQIWTEGFSEGTEADASASFKYPSGGSTPSTTAPATTAPATTSAPTTLPPATTNTTTETEASTENGTESSSETSSESPTEATTEAIPVLKVEIPVLKQVGEAEIEYTYGNGSFSLSPVTLSGTAFEVTVAQIFNENRELASVLLKQNNTVLAQWKGAVTLAENETQSIALTPLTEGREVSTTVLLDGEAYTGNSLKITYLTPDTKTVIGEGTAILREGEQVGIRVQTTSDDTVLFAQYDFLSTSSAPILLTIPKTGNLTISFESKPGYMKLMGRVMDTNIPSAPISSAKVALTQTTPSGSSYSQVTYTDEDGYYAIYGINKGNRNYLTVSRAGYEVFDNAVTFDETKVKQSQDFSLMKLATRVIMTFKPAPVVDEKGIYEAASYDILKHLTLTLIDAQNQPIKTDTIKRDNIDGTITYEVVPTDIKTIRPEMPYTVTVSSGNTVEAHFDVLLNLNGPTAIEGAIEPKGAIIYRAISAAEVPLIGYAAAFDTKTGNKVVGISTTFGKESNDRLMYLPSGSYTLILIDDRHGIGARAATIDELTAFFGKDEYLMIKDVSVTDKTGTYLSTDSDTPFEVPEGVESYFITQPESWIEAPKTHDGAQMIKVTGRVMPRVNTEATVKKITVKVIDNQTRDIIAGNIPAEGFVYGGSVYSTVSNTQSTFFIQELILPVENASPNNFYFYIKPIQGADDLFVEVYAELEIDGKAYESQLVGEAQIIGAPVTLHGNARSATQKIELTGKAPIGETVLVYEGNSVLGRVVANDYGRWMLSVNLLGTMENSETVHTLKATAAGLSSTPLVVIHDGDSPALTKVTMSATQIGNDEWSSGSYYIYLGGYNYYFNAYFENANALAPEINFYVTCSNGKVVELPADKVVGNKVSSATYRFSDENLVPVSVNVGYHPKPKEKASIETPKVHEEAVNETIQQAKTTNYAVMASQVISNIQSAGYAMKTGVSTSGKPPVGQFAIDYQYEPLTPSQVLATVDGSFKHYVSSRQNGRPLLDLYSKMEALESGYRYTVYGINYADNPSGEGYYAVCIYQYNQGTSQSMKLPKYASAFPRLVLSAAEQPTSSDIQVTGPMEFAKQHSILFPNSPAANITKNIVMIDNINSGLERQSEAEHMRQTYDYMESMMSRLKNQGIDTTRLENMIQNGRNSADTAVRLVNDGAVSGGFGDLVTGLTSAIDPTEVGAYYMNLMVGYSGLEMDAQAEVVFNGAQGDYLEALLQFQKLTGVDRETFMKGLESYSTGAGYEIPITNVERYGKGYDESNYENYELYFIPKIDPSGFIYEAVLSNKLAGATVTLFNEVEGAPVLWDAYSFDFQKNPQNSVTDGRYAWEVPEGLWFVEASLDGYESNNSLMDPAATVEMGGMKWLPVLPPQLNVHIGLTNLEAPTVRAEGSGDGTVELQFSRYLLPETLVQGIQVLVNDKALETSQYTLSPENAEVSPEHTPLCGGETLASIYKLTLKGVKANDDVTLQFASSVMSYAKVPMAETVVSVKDVQKSSLSLYLLIAGVFVAAGGGGVAVWMKRKKSITDVKQ